MEIDIIYDTVCPWCYIGKRRLEKALEARPQVKARPKWRPFLLNPEMPSEGIDRTAYLIKKFGSEARVRRIYGAIGEAGQSVEIDFAFERIGDIGVLTKIGAAHGLDAEDVEAYLESNDNVRLIYDENAHAHRLGINGVPSFAFNDKFVISGAQEPQVLERVLDAAMAADAAREAKARA